LGDGATAAGGEWADRFARRLRTGDPPVYGRIEDQRLVLDLRTVLPEDDERLAEAVLAAAHAPDEPTESA
jgi:L-seryl-tRNA(Ser) seleniumtransferase